jgi:hypothetical protein
LGDCRRPDANVLELTGGNDSGESRMNIIKMTEEQRNAIARLLNDFLDAADAPFWDRLNCFEEEYQPQLAKQFKADADITREWMREVGVYPEVTYEYPELAEELAGQ